MSRIRTIKPEFWQNEQLASVSLHARLLAISLLNHSDDDGLFLANVSLVRSNCFPFEDDSKNVLGSLQELSQIGYIAIRECSGKMIGRVEKFREHQRIDKPQKSKLKTMFEAAELDVAVEEPAIIDENQQKPNKTELFQDDSRNVPGTIQERSAPGTGKGNREQGKGTGIVTSADAGETRDEGLRDWICWWNDLRRSQPPLVPVGVKENAPSEAILKSWKRVMADKRLRELIAKRDLIEQELRLSSFAREGGWFRPEKLLGGKNKDGEIMLVKLLDGGYRDQKTRKGQHDSRNETQTVGSGSLLG